MNMRITNLHLIISFLILSGAGLMFYQGYLRNVPATLPPIGFVPSPALPAAPAATEPAKALGSPGTEAAQGTGSPEAQAAAERPTAPLPARRLEVYVVRRGDNLWSISKRADVYGRGAGWVKIWRANEKKVPDFDLLYSGTTLTIPPQK